MPHTLGIKINNMPFQDNWVKLIAFYCLGLDNSEISPVMDLKESTLRNMASVLYSILDTGRSPQSLAREGQKLGFDRYGYFKKQDVLTERERRRMYRVAPRLRREKQDA